MSPAEAPPFRPVLDCCEQYFQWYASVHRGSGFKSRLSTHVFERCREVVADFIGADLTHHALIFTQNATHALNKLAMHVCTASDQIVLSTVMEHHSNMLPWRKMASRLDYVRVTRDGDLDLDDLEAKARRYGNQLGLITVIPGLLLQALIRYRHQEQNI